MVKTYAHRGEDNATLADLVIGRGLFGDMPFRSKVTLKRYVDVNESPKAYSYEISNIEVLKGVVGFVTRPSDKTSMDVGILLIRRLRCQRRPAAHDAVSVMAGATPFVLTGMGFPANWQSLALWQ